MNVVLDVIEAKNQTGISEHSPPRVLSCRLALRGGIVIGYDGLILQSATWIGTTLRNRPIEQKVLAVQGSLPRCCRGSTPVICDL